ncbi:CopD family protein [Rhodococcus sp. X156]|uniref:CopD family protein n=1 Tax=Rhodococcus sp. X156 TaxID=2499145 RepID=UPI000FDB051C|nr:CopD family protein [Rhodococcus sp. X156]
MSTVGAASSTRRQLVLLVAAPTALLGLLVAALVSRPAHQPPSDYLRLAALLAGAALLGTCVVVYLEQPRRRAAMAQRLHTTQLALATAWLLAEVVLLAAAAAEADGRSLPTVRAASVGAYLQSTVGGTVALVVCGCVVALLALVAVARRTGAAWSSAGVLALAVVALAARPLTGHAHASALAQLLVVVHVVAAATWCGGLVALALAAGPARGTWARTLPRFSVLAGWCVLALAVSGAGAALLEVGGVGALLSTGYGRIVLVKVVVLAALLGLGLLARRRWVPAAADHRTPAEVSLRRAVVEVAVMGLALGLATALATTG